ncbi:hypothetical protein QBC44DRAFT_327726 [Cladorrhinum sp. PSN332]|nr:hypothetical protein QBC44DRAFT_327726 [Cladorrhinum sp. PSN332]
MAATEMPAATPPREHQVFWPSVKACLRLEDSTMLPAETSMPYGLCPICYSELDIARVPPLEATGSPPRRPGVVLSCGHMMCRDCWGRSIWITPKDKSDLDQWKAAEPRICPFRCTLRFTHCECIIPPIQIPGNGCKNPRVCTQRVLATKGEKACQDKPAVKPSYCDGCMIAGLLAILRSMIPWLEQLVGKFPWPTAASMITDRNKSRLGRWDVPLEIANEFNRAALQVRYIVGKNDAKFWFKVQFNLMKSIIDIHKRRGRTWGSRNAYGAPYVSLNAVVKDACPSPYQACQCVEAPNGGFYHYIKVLRC